MRFQTQSYRGEVKDSPLSDLNKFILPNIENMPFLMLCFKLQD